MNSFINRKFINFILARGGHEDGPALTQEPYYEVHMADGTKLTIEQKVLSKILDFTGLDSVEVLFGPWEWSKAETAFLNVHNIVYATKGREDDGPGEIIVQMFGNNHDKMYVKGLDLDTIKRRIEGR